MNQQPKIDIRHSTCPHDCPSACALDVEVIDGSSIGRVRGSKVQTYTAGVVCAKANGVANKQAAAVTIKKRFMRVLPRKRPRPAL